MNTIELKLRAEDARLVYLAVAYHLGRPGSELDPLTKQPVEHGLAETARTLQPQLRLAVSKVDLNEDQVRRLQSGMLGAITELKAYPMLQPRSTEDGGQRRSTVPGFDRSLLHLFPEVEEEPELTLDVAERMLLLKRRFDQQIKDLPAPATAPEPEKRSRAFWPFKR